MKTELLAKKEQLEKQIVEIRPAASASKTTDASPPPATEKWSKENHPAFRKNASATPAPVEEQKAFAIGDTVSAKYSADKAFYPANIISITGSSAAPIYTIKFKGYNETATVRAHEIRAIPSSTSTVQKRKADGSPVVSTPAMAGHATTPTANGSVISAAANIDSALANAIRKEPSKVSDGPARPERIAKKVKTKNALEKSKNNWKDWQAKGSAGKAAKVVNKESMFRTGEAHTARGTRNWSFLY